jgi:hypothetical protein
MRVLRAQRLGAGVALALILAVDVAVAQTPRSTVPDALRNAPPEVDESRPPIRPGERSGGPASPGTAEGGGGTPRGVIRPPAGLDPGIHTTVPDPTPNTTPVIPPPGSPGGDPRVIPR